MKSKHLLFLAGAAAVMVTIAVIAKTAVHSKNLVVHEWGTFTSLQGGDGKPIHWKPLKTAELPGFVHDWRKPGLGLFSISPLGMFIKGEITSLQRMETPVIYFYSEQPQKVDVSVRFPEGLVTEWYPRATKIGPSKVIPDTNSPRSTESLATKDSVIEWSGVSLQSEAQKDAPLSGLPQDSKGSHYFAARDTDATLLATASVDSTKTPESEKFLFYRGLGNFGTPMQAAMDINGNVSVTCGAWTDIEHVFVLSVKNKTGNFSEISRLGPGETQVISPGITKRTLPEGLLVKRLSESVKRALVSQGLYPKEAQAMVNTWKDSWFAEDGVRVLYILPRAWTDATLPMTLNPQPKELVRVMVGRAEILSPELEKSLADSLDAAKHGDAAAKERVAATLKSLGRFAEPALQRAFAKSTYRPDQNMAYWALLTARPSIN